MDNNYLSHHGIKGMRWGIRRYQNKDGSLTAAGKRKYGDKDTGDSESSNKTSNKKTGESVKSIKDMSNADLKAAIDRMRLEQDYKNMVKNQSQMSAGKKFLDKYKDSVIDKLADGVAADLTAQVVKGFAARGINKALNNPKIGFSGDVVFTNNKKKN